jgi:hypothetical protein
MHVIQEHVIQEQDCYRFSRIAAGDQKDDKQANTHDDCHQCAPAC